VRAWIDIDNPPQVRYLLPFVRRFEDAGYEVLVTARAYGDTFAILRSEGANFEPIGSSFGKGRMRKIYGTASRARTLVALVRDRWSGADFVLTGSRSATLAARRLGIPSFVIVDYEHVDLLAYRLSGSQILYPSVIDCGAFRHRGIRPENLMPFEGLKEDISFADLDSSSIPASDFGGCDESAVRVLFRPPAEESHYYRSESGDFSLELLRFLAATPATIVFSPRYDWQIVYLDETPEWQSDPVVLREPAPFVSLLKGVDAVVSAGGTMLREAAYLGVPAYSIFRGSIGDVDRYLASIDRLVILSSPADFSRIELKPKESLSPLREHSTVADEVTSMILDRMNGRNDGAGPSVRARLRARARRS
jgi:predicted glycosyltransferase